MEATTQETIVLHEAPRMPEPGDKFYIPDEEVLKKWIELRDSLSLAAIVEMVRQDLDALEEDPPTRLYGLLNETRRTLKDAGL